LITRREHDRRIRARDEKIGKLLQRVLDAEARHDEVEGKRRNLARWLADATATNKRLTGRNKELQRRLDAAHDNQLSESAEVTRLDAEHDARRQALAEALGAGRDLPWDELIKLAALGAVEASREEIEAWERRAKAHDGWVPPSGPEAWEKRPVDGASARPTHPATELRRALDRCRALQALLDGRGKRVAS
jgi:hypothetical protein